MWAAMLAKMVAPMDAERAAKAIMGMVPMLAFPDQAFTPESVREVCASGQIRGDYHGPLSRVPTFGELETALGRWWAKRRELELLDAPTPRPKLPAPKKSPTEQECEHVAKLLRVFVEERSAMPEKKRVIKPSYLSDAALAAEYERNGIRNPRKMT
jgi:hypothetical protein